MIPAAMAPALVRGGLGGSEPTLGGEEEEEEEEKGAMEALGEGASPRTETVTTGEGDDGATEPCWSTSDDWPARPGDGAPSTELAEGLAGASDVAGEAATGEREAGEAEIAVGGATALAEETSAPGEGEGERDGEGEGCWAAGAAEVEAGELSWVSAGAAGEGFGWGVEKMVCTATFWSTVDVILTSWTTWNVATLARESASEFSSLISRRRWM